MGSVQNLFVLFWRSVAKEDCVFWFDVLFKSDNPGNASLWYHARSGLLRSVLLLMDVRVVTIGLTLSLTPQANLYPIMQLPYLRALEVNLLIIDLANWV